MMRSRASTSVSDDDPLTRAMEPPANETESEREARLEAALEAKRISDVIDEELNRQRIAEKKAPKAVRVLLLGQSESGKSTTLKNFRLMNSDKAFGAERASWRTIIQLNVVHSMCLILDAMSEDQENTRSLTPVGYSQDLLKLKLRLSPLAQIQETLIRKLTHAGSGDFEATRLSSIANIPNRYRTKEVSLNSSVWDSFGRMMKWGTVQNDDGIDWDDPKDPGTALHACGKDMIRLWNDPTVKALLEAQSLRLEDMSGFFLDSLDRITQQRYVPTDDDILKARIKTLGVSEHLFTMKTGGLWKIYDVGGHRSQRAAWVPFFEDMDAIIFLAPISCFDQKLVEDPSVNRLEDSFLLWKAVVSNLLLKRTSLVLFLNKCDILAAKLSAGVKLSRYIVSYGDRPNDFKTASHYLCKKFQGIFMEHSKESRAFYPHFTSVTDAKSTKLILESVQDVLVRQHLKDSQLLI